MSFWLNQRLLVPDLHLCVKEAKMEHEFRNTIKYLYTFLIHSYTSFDPTNKIFLHMQNKTHI